MKKTIAFTGLILFFLAAFGQSTVFAQTENLFQTLTGGGSKTWTVQNATSNGAENAEWRNATLVLTHQKTFECNRKINGALKKETGTWSYSPQGPSVALTSEDGKGRMMLEKLKTEGKTITAQLRDAQGISQIELVSQ